MALKPGKSLLSDSSCGGTVKVSRYDLVVVQRNGNPQHRVSARDKSPVGHGYAAATIGTDTLDDPIFKDVLNSEGGNSIVRFPAQMPGQPSGDAAGGDGLRQGASVAGQIFAPLANHDAYAGAYSPPTGAGCDRAARTGARCTDARRKSTATTSHSLPSSNHWR